MANNPLPIGGQFGQLIVNKDYAGAFDLLASTLKSRMTLAEFRKLFKEASKARGPIVAFEFDVNLLDQKGAWNKFEQKGITLPAELDPKTFKRWMTVEFKPESDSNSQKGYECWLIVVEEKAQEGIGYFEILIP